jgi:hypothetical protein
VRPELVAFPQSGFAPERTPISLESKATGVRGVVPALLPYLLFIRTICFAGSDLRSKNRRNQRVHLLLNSSRVKSSGVNAKYSTSIQLKEDLVPAVNFLDLKSTGAIT